LELVHLEENQREERKAFDHEQQTEYKIELSDFEKDLKGTIKLRKRANRPMSKEEVLSVFAYSSLLLLQLNLSLFSQPKIAWEREVHEKSHEEKLEEKLKELEARQKQELENLEAKQQEQIQALLSYYEAMEKSILSLTPAN